MLLPLLVFLLSLLLFFPLLLLHLLTRVLLCHTRLVFLDLSQILCPNLVCCELSLLEETRLTHGSKMVFFCVGRLHFETGVKIAQFVVTIADAVQIDRVT